MFLYKIIFVHYVDDIFLPTMPYLALWKQPFWIFWLL